MPCYLTNEVANLPNALAGNVAAQDACRLGHGPRPFQGLEEESIMFQATSLPVIRESMACGRAAYGR